MKKTKIIRKSKPSIKLERVALLIFLPMLILAIILQFINAKPNQKEQIKSDIKTEGRSCTKRSLLNLTDDTLPIIPTVINNEIICYDFYAESGQKLVLQSSANVTLVNTSQFSQIVKATDGKAKEVTLPETGYYSILVLDKDIQVEPIIISLQSKVSSFSSINQNPMRIITTYDYNQGSSLIYSSLRYNPAIQPNFKQSQKLEQVVNDIVVFVSSKGLPINRLSVSLIDLRESECCYYAGYSDQESRFPASVAKLFWMVYLYGQYEAGFLSPGIVPHKQLQKMIQDSDNESASFIVDTITGTKSGANLTEYELQKWIQKRLAMNLFFEQAGYSKINISQKLFPTKQFQEPVGRDLQIRTSLSNPIRDYMTTYSVARLLFEIEQEVAISRKYSKEMKKLLKRSLYPEAWKSKEFNAIEGFLGEGLPRDAYFASKMGWNFNTRNDAAIIGSPDGKHKYILVIFGDHSSFYQDKKLFPELSRMVYEKMTN